MASWVQVAPKSTETPPATDTQIKSLIEFDGELYGGSYINGRLQKWNGTDAWELICGTTGILGNGSNDRGALQSMLVFNDELYAGNALTSVADTVTGGGLLKFNGTDAWEVKAVGLTSGQTILCLAEFDGKIYGGGSAGGGTNAALSQWNGSSAWVKVAPPYLGGTTSIYSLAEYSNELYAGEGGGGGRLLKWNGLDNWTLAAAGYTPSGGSLQLNIWDLVLYREELYGCTGAAALATQGYLLRFTGAAWEEVAAGPGIYDMIKLQVHENRLFGVDEIGNLYLWNDSNAWISVATAIGGGELPYSFYSFNDNLYVGTGNNARLYELDGWAPGTGAETGQTLAVDVSSRTWRSVGHKVDAMYYAQDTDQLIASIPFDGYYGVTDIIAELEVPGMDSISSSQIDFEVETKHIRLHPEQPVQVRWVHIDADTQDQDLTVTLILDGTEVALGTLSSDGRTRTTFPTNRWGRLAGVRLESTEIIDQVKIYGIEIEHHDTQGTLP